MTVPQFLDQLTKVEDQVQQLTQAMAASGPDALVAVADALQRALLDFSRLAQQVRPQTSWDAASKRRVKALAATLAMQRESITRRAALTELTLKSLLPSVQADTYAPPMGTSARSAYGSVGRRSGEFRASTA